MNLNQDTIRNYPVQLTSAGLAQVEKFRGQHDGTRVLTILMTDLEASTRQQSQMGNLAAYELTRLHRHLFRQLLTLFDGQEVETAGDAFLVIFASPSTAVRFALQMQHVMRTARKDNPQLALVRVGLHQGQVVVEQHEQGESDAILGKAIDIYGVQVSITARITDLAQGDQILCTRSVFDDARAILRGVDLKGLGPVDWRNYGQYRFKGVEDAYEVCEVGEVGSARLIAPESTEKSWPADLSDEIPGWRPAVGVRVPHSNWTLAERLGQDEYATEGAKRYCGQFGEVWKAYNPSDKSHQVFKFCFRREHVPVLKREARILKKLRNYRHRNLVDVFDVTEGERPPHYIEMEYIAGPTAEAWIRTNPPMTERLEIIAQVADALRAIHAEGIYHRDVKPSNILLQRTPNGDLIAKLSDFGLGAADDPELLRSIYASRVENLAGTWDYIAPEIRNGEKASAMSDVYSLGLVLYQYTVGDLRALMGPDWQERVDSRVLREDIRCCMRSSPSDRITAAELAAWLRDAEGRVAREVELRKREEEQQDWEQQKLSMQEELHLRNQTLYELRTQRQGTCSRCLKNTLTDYSIVSECELCGAPICGGCWRQGQRRCADHCGKSVD